MLNFQKTLLAALFAAGPCFSTPLPRPQLYSTPKNEPEPSVASKPKGDLDPQGTFGLNVFTAPLGGVYAGVGSVNPNSYGLGSIGTAYGVNQLNSGGLGGIPGGFGAAGGVGALGPAGLGGYGALGGFGGGLGGFGGGIGGLTGGLGGLSGGLGGLSGGLGGLSGGLGGLSGGLGGLSGGLGGLSGGLGGLSGGLGGLGGGYQLGGLGGLGGINNGYLGSGNLGLLGGAGGLYSGGDTHSERIRRKFFKALEKIRRRTGHMGQLGILQSPFIPYGMYGGLGGQYGGLGLGFGQGIGGGLPLGGGLVNINGPSVIPVPVPTSSSFFNQRFSSPSVLEITKKRIFDSVGTYLQSRIPRLVDRLVFDDQDEED